MNVLEGVVVPVGVADIRMLGVVEIPSNRHPIQILRAMESFARDNHSRVMFKEFALLARCLRQFPESVVALLEKGFF